MDDSGEVSGQSTATAWLHALRPAVPAAVGAGALTFLFAAVMPLDWIFGIGWHLYLDRLSDLFVPPVGNGARLVFALALSVLAAWIAAFVALIASDPEAAGLAALGRRLRWRQREEAEDLPLRRRADLHPDDLPRAPIRAGRDLPAEGLGPLAAATPEASASDDGGDELILADLAPIEITVSGDEPWLQPVAAAGPAMPDPADKSLGAMVARLEAGLARRRDIPATATAAAIPVPDTAADESADPDVDFALEAALSTLQRMNRGAFG